MAHYRLYYMQPYSGHIVRFDEYEAVNDEAAISRACEREGEHALELWSLRRKVLRIEPVNAAGAISPAWKPALPEPSAAQTSSGE